MDTYNIVLRRGIIHAQAISALPIALYLPLLQFLAMQSPHGIVYLWKATDSDQSCAIYQSREVIDLPDLAAQFNAIQPGWMIDENHILHSPPGEKVEVDVEELLEAALHGDDLIEVGTPKIEAA